MDALLDRYYLPKLNQDQATSLNSLQPLKKEKQPLSLPTKKGPGADGFSAEFYQIFQEEIIPILLKLFHKLKTEGTFQTVNPQ